ncbi:MAG: hypothetical protein RLP14_02915 [Owenweeksia sp.]
MKKMIFSCFLLIAGAATALAQSSPLTVTNNTNCAFEIELFNTEDGCGASCSVTICIPPGPGTMQVVNPCNPDWFWDRAIVTPTIDACTPCGSPSVGVASPNPTNCLGLPNSDNGIHCAGCGPYMVVFSSPTNLDLF